MKLNGWKKACALLSLCAATAIGSSAQTFTTLLSFDYTNGAYPSGSLIQGFNGNLYGTTGEGGNPLCYGGDACGTVFEITDGGTLTSLHSFDTTDGAHPNAPLVQAADGDFYGATSWGGSFCTPSGCGTVFEITAGGALTSLYSFCSQTSCTDGSTPYSGLVQGKDGNLYGTTSNGGNSQCHDCGTVFKITPAGTLTTLYSFCPQTGCTDGATPNGLVLSTNGNLYGTTYSGGVNHSGTVFTVTPTGKLTTLYSFCAQASCTDGASPGAGLIQATDGNFYGTTEGGGQLHSPLCAKFGGCGTVFKITPEGKLTTLYRFCARRNCTDGAFPDATLVQATDGYFYGTTGHGGTYNPPCDAGCGTVFVISPTTLTVLHSFCSLTGCTDGMSPGGLVQSTNGILYGITGSGGQTSTNCGTITDPGCGTVYSLNMGLGPFVKTNPAMGKVGSVVGILGNNLKGTTSVSFNGTSTTFTVWSGSYIKAAVPVGATSGYVTVTTPNETLTSNVPFHVIP